RPSKGTLRFTNLKTKSTFESRRPVRVSGSMIEVVDVEIGAGFHWETKENRKYAGRLEFLIDRLGRLTLINEAPLEEYLKGVVPSEMPVGFPIEALKAQAIAARVEVASKIDIRHPFQPFDLCDEVHCQVYSGLSKTAKSTNTAIKNTRGIFIVHGTQVIEAFYAGMCGGHTENNDNVWLMDGKPYLRGIQDGRSDRRRLALEQEKNVREWIDGFPNVFCNTRSKRVPEFLNYSKKYFRWQQTFPRNELEEIIHRKTGETFGNLLDLIPKQRGVSGRVLELEVIGSQKRFIINRELSIRQALSETTLFSSCFYIKKVGASGLPSKFIVKGAGWGHGVGMCQVGAAVMAHSGAKFDQILKHYYRRTSLQLLYK
ncbi:SpoIID/LytB domain-containing protein, partial [bacterium]|nr:SpoIID/LytB domain-containing protein [bacterium]